MKTGILLLDTNIISTFAKIEQMDLLFELGGKMKFGISINVLNELEDARNIGLSFVNKVFELIDKKKISIFSMIDKEIIWSMNLPSSLGKGERDSLAICKYT